MIKKKFPILEFDNDRKAIINPDILHKDKKFNKHLVLCFFKEVIDKLVNEGKAKEIYAFRSEMGRHPLYEIEYNNKKISVAHSPVGAPLAAGLLEETIATGACHIIACGGCGVLEKEISVGNVLVPRVAVRDEGTSYHYIKPHREISVNKKALKAIEETLSFHKCNYLVTKTWTTDALFRETIDKMKLRREEGCLAVEMECSAFCAVAEFRNVEFAQILYGGDDISCEEWDNRKWHKRTEIREALFWFSVEACIKL